MCFGFRLVWTPPNLHKKTFLFYPTDTLDEEVSWEFIFLAANQDAFAEAAKIGIDQKDSFNFDSTKEGIKEAYFNLSSSVKKYRERE